MEKKQKNPDRKFLDDLDEKYAAYKERIKVQENKGSEEKRQSSQSVKKQDKVNVDIKTKEKSEKLKKPKRTFSFKCLKVFERKKKEVVVVKPVVEDKTSEKKSEEKTEDVKETKKKHKKESPYAEYYKKHKKIKRKRTSKRHLLETYLRKAGFDMIEPSKIRKRLIRSSLIAAIGVFIMAFVYSLMLNMSAINVIIYSLSFGAMIFGLVMVAAWTLLYVYLDVKIFRRKQSVEDVLPDFLQLTSANISAGMPIDKAMWLAIRPQFGVLSNEIQGVAKATMAGESLETALHTFTKKYDSPIVTRAINLLLEGLASGGEMADLLNKISTDIQEIKLMNKEMAADVMTYVLFITIATIFISPFLFGLATQLLGIVQNIISNLSSSAGASSGAGGMFSFNFSDESIKISDFRIFCISMLVVSSFFSACIISMIRKGNVKEGLKNIPIFIIITVSLYFLANWILGAVFSGFF